MIICGDMNNSAYSYVSQYQRKLKDSFEEAGKGFGETYKFHYPARIDYIFADEK
jgi:endonuclease/exonuclease/phosphatase family metal-dependent hydrolase